MKRRRFLKHALAGGALTTVGASLRSFASGKELDSRSLLASSGTNSGYSTTFARRFPNLPKQGLKNPRLEEGLIELAKKLKSDQDDSPPDSKHLPPLAGYTYFGQFIDHDLTLDLTPLEAAASVKVEQIQNFRTPFLDLDHLYGGGPNLAPFLYENSAEQRQAERFLIGKTVLADGKEGHPGDIPRSPQGLALAGDPREDENLILAQMHVAFLKLHNAVVDENSDALQKSPYYLQAGTRFAAAQRLLRWHYQWVVRHDYLHVLLDETVFKQLESEEQSDLRTQPNPQIPIEFNVAAFRFGHSMVRGDYKINGRLSLHLADLLQRTGPMEGPSFRLREDSVVEWRFFLAVKTSLGAQLSAMINSRIAGGLYGVPVRIRELFNVPTTNSEQRLPVRTLLRGARLGLPSGQKVACALGFKPLCGARLGVGPESQVLRDYGFLEDTPLWYYILKEAELIGQGARLGPTGSRLIADVIMASLRADPDSYLSVAKDPPWCPTLPVGYPRTDKKLFNLSDLIRFVS